MGLKQFSLSLLASPVRSTRTMSYLEENRRSIISVRFTPSMRLIRPFVGNGTPPDAVVLTGPSHRDGAVKDILAENVHGNSRTPVRAAGVQESIQVALLLFIHRQEGDLVQDYDRFTLGVRKVVWAWEGILVEVSEFETLAVTENVEVSGPFWAMVHDNVSVEAPGLPRNQIEHARVLAKRYGCREDTTGRKGESVVSPKSVVLLA